MAQKMRMLRKIGSDWSNIDSYNWGELIVNERYDWSPVAAVLPDDEPNAYSVELYYANEDNHIVPVQISQSNVRGLSSEISHIDSMLQSALIDLANLEANAPDGTLHASATINGSNAGAYTMHESAISPTNGRYDLDVTSSVVAYDHSTLAHYFKSTAPAMGISYDVIGWHEYYLELLDSANNMVQSDVDITYGHQIQYRRGSTGGGWALEHRVDRRHGVFQHRPANFSLSVLTSTECVQTRFRESIEFDSSESVECMYAFSAFGIPAGAKLRLWRRFRFAAQLNIPTPAKFL